jgi:hypothetical protein
MYNRLAEENCDQMKEYWVGEAWSKQRGDEIFL